MNGLSFDLTNKTTVFESARALAFENAKQKGKDYSSALRIRLGRVVNIKDTFSSAPVINDNTLNKDESLIVGAPSTPTVVNVGTIPISYNVEVIFDFRQ